MMYLVHSCSLSASRLTLGQKKADTLVLHDALNHWETLFVVSTGDAADVTLPLGAEGVNWDLLSHALVVEWAPTKSE